MGSREEEEEASGGGPPTWVEEGLTAAKHTGGWRSRTANHASCFGGGGTMEELVGMKQKMRRGADGGPAGVRCFLRVGSDVPVNNGSGGEKGEGAPCCRRESGRTVHGIV